MRWTARCRLQRRTWPAPAYETNGPNATFGTFVQVANALYQVDNELITNTMPSVIMPWLALGLVPSFGFAGLFVLLALLAFVSAAILLFLARNSRER